jgi:hypothetical protein
MTTTPIAKPSISVTSILNILTIALAALSALPVVGPEAALADDLVKIITAGMAAYQSATGQALDLTKMPIEVQVP